MGMKLPVVLEVKEQDNSFVVAAKGATVGWGLATIVIGGAVSTLLLIGKCVGSKEQLQKFEEEAGAE